MFIQLSDNKHSLDAAMCYNNLGLLYSDQGEYKTGRVMYKKALDIYLKYYEEAAHPHVAGNYNNLGANYTRTGELELAEEMYLKALKQRKEIYGNNPHPDLATSYINLGAIYFARQNYLMAEKMYDFALNQRIKVYVDNEFHLDIAACYDNFGNLYNQMNYLNTAELLHLKALVLKLKICSNGPHPEVALTRYNLGTLYAKQGLYWRAIQQFEECLLIMRKVHKGNEAYPMIIDCKQNLHNARTEAQQELFKEEKEINLFNIFRDNCKSFGFLNPETQLSLIYFNNHMNSIDICIYVQIFNIYPLYVT